MSAAIKRLSTIIRPSNASSPPSPPKESNKSSIDAPAPAAPVDASTAEVPPIVEENPNSTTTDAVKDAGDSPAPVAEQGSTTAPASPDDVKDTPSTPKDKDAPSSVDSKTEKEGKPTHRRDPRDIGRSTIRRFSTILRSQVKDAHKDKEPIPPMPSQEDSANAKDGETKTPAAEETPKETDAKESGTTDSSPASKNAKPAKSPLKSDGKVTRRRPSYFFTAAREGLQRTAKDVQTRARGQPGPAKVKAAAKAEAVPKILKKGAAKGKRVVVITGASKGIGLEFVKQFATQPNTFVIALSRTAERSTALKPIVSASVKEGHNVRTMKLDLTSSRSIHNVVKDIVELTDGRIDLVINAAGSRGDPALKVWDIKGSELEEEMRTNLIGPLALTNALIPYLKPMPPKEEKKEKEAENSEKSDTKPEMVEEKAEAKEEKLEAKEEQAEEPKAETVPAAVEQPETTETKPDAQELAATPTTAVYKQDTATAEAPVEKSTDTEPAEAAPAEAVPAKAAPAEIAPTEAAPAEAAPAEAVPAEGESTEPSPGEVPSLLPTYPFVVFLAPSDPIQNVEGSVPTGHSFAPSPRTLFSLSRAALQVAIAKYAVGLGGKNIGIVGVERHGHNDPHSGVSDEQSAASVIKSFPELSIRDNGKLLRTGA